LKPDHHQAGGNIEEPDRINRKMTAMGRQPVSSQPVGDISQGRIPGFRRWARSHRIPITFTVTTAILYSILAVRRHVTFHTAGWDLGIFEQAIRNYASFRMPITVLKGTGFNLLGDHFHPILMLLAPFYALFPTPVTLLIAQAMLFGIAAWPLVSWARASLGARVAVAVGIIYGLSFGIASAVGFDFHEIAFAVPLIAFSLSALGQNRMRTAVLFALPLVFVKEDLGITVVAVIGVLMIIRGARRLGTIVAVSGLVSTALEVGVILPLINGSAYEYWSRVAGHPMLTVLTSSAGQKAVTLILTVAITGFAALYSPIALVAIPTLVWRFASSDANYWGTDFHYSAILMPIMVAAMIDGLIRARNRRILGLRASPVLLAVALSVTIVTLPSHSLAQLVNEKLWTDTPHSLAITDALGIIPDGATVSASDNLVPQLTSRDTVTLFGLRPLATTKPQWIVVDPESTRHFRVTRTTEQKDLLAAEHSGYVVRFQSQHITLLHRAATASTSTPAAVKTYDRQPAPSPKSTPKMAVQ
jgi:uncharacterized membrane protein